MLFVPYCRVQNARHMALSSVLFLTKIIQVTGSASSRWTPWTEEYLTTCTEYN
jgi:hypothetical protein